LTRYWIKNKQTAALANTKSVPMPPFAFYSPLSCFVFQLNSDLNLYCVWSLSISTLSKGISTRRICRAEYPFLPAADSKKFCNALHIFLHVGLLSHIWQNCFMFTSNKKAEAYHVLP
jgi:hypothetical protein